MSGVQPFLSGSHPYDSTWSSTDPQFVTNAKGAFRIQVVKTDQFIQIQTIANPDAVKGFTGTDGMIADTGRWGRLFRGRLKGNLGTVLL